MRPGGGGGVGRLFGGAIGFCDAGRGGLSLFAARDEINCFPSPVSSFGVVGLPVCSWGR